MCTDREGQLLWTNTDLAYEGIHGVGASPVLAGDYLVILNSMATAPYITAIRTQTGARVWTTKLPPRRSVHGHHRTPAIVSVSGKPAILVGGNHRVAAYTLATGKQLWERPIEFPTPCEVVASILVEGDTLYWPHRAVFRAISLTKLAQGKVPVLWETKMGGKGPVTPSPVHCRGLLFMISDRGHATCLDAVTGTLLWRKRLKGRQYLSSPVVVGDRVYFSSTEGDTVVVACDREFVRLAESSLDDTLIASPACLDGQIFFRTDRKLWCVERQQVRGPALPSGEPEQRHSDGPDRGSGRNSTMADAPLPESAEPRALD